MYQDNNCLVQNPYQYREVNTTDNPIEFEMKCRAMSRDAVFFVKMDAISGFETNWKILHKTTNADIQKQTSN